MPWYVHIGWKKPIIHITENSLQLAVFSLYVYKYLVQLFFSMLWAILWSERMASFCWSCKFPTPRVLSLPIFHMKNTNDIKRMNARWDNTRVNPATGNSRQVCETRKTCETRHVCIGYFMLFMLLHEIDSRISNRLVVEAVIFLESKGFSRAIRDKI